MNRGGFDFKGADLEARHPRFLGFNQIVHRAGRLLVMRELDDTLGLSDLAPAELRNTRPGKNIWSLTSLQLKLIKIGARVVRHARAITF